METSYGEYIKFHRMKSGFKMQKQLADRTGISAATISRIEKEIQKPEVKTLQTFAKVLDSTSFVELMVACGYWGEDELLEVNQGQGKELVSEYQQVPNKVADAGSNYSTKKETPASDSNEEEFLNDINLSDEDLLKRYELKIDGKSLTEEETKGILTYIRTLRQMQN